jgi:hypothetical protein
MRNLRSNTPATPSPNQIRRNRNYVRKLKAQEDQKRQHSSSADRSYEEELDEYSSARLSMFNSPNAAAAPSTSPIKSPNSVISIHDDSEIEEGEIVEQEVTQCVDLIEESFSALKDARKITDLSPMKSMPLFFEDKRTDDKWKELPPPLYNTVGENDDVIVLDSTLNLSQNSAATDDSIIFVSEEPRPLQKPKALLTPSINELMKISGVNITPLSSKEAKQLSPGQVKRRERVAKYHKKRKREMEYAKKEVAQAMKGNSNNSVNNFNQPSTSKAALASAAGSTEKKKRIILIDGSNVAITHAKSKQGREYDEKSFRAFSVEGLLRPLKF